MGKCINHPDRETSYLCMKHNVYLCEECLECRDPEIYCKFRSSCPIWFLSKRKEGLDEVDGREAEKKSKQLKVIFNPDKKEILVPEGTSLLKAARLADIHLNASCNGNR